MKFRLVAAVTLAAFAAGCTTDPYTGQQKPANAASGAALGALAGAGLGLLAGGDDRKNALIGAGIGALAGAGIGAYMDQQEKELRGQLEGTGVSVTRSGDFIVLNMPSNITFPVDGDKVLPGFAPTLNSVALVVKKYNKTTIDVAGHTDATGDDAYNQGLSERRALAVANYIHGQGIDGRRFAVEGFGETQPIASNKNEAGRSQNRRVEIKLAPLT
ncbi:MAG: OmpA family protein [Phyllobacteriaceae bacterium]|nr:OmpA family protein [Phyllobacteriaceae bacterium]